MGSGAGDRQVSWLYEVSGRADGLTSQVRVRVVEEGLDDTWRSWLAGEYMVGQAGG